MTDRPIPQNLESQPSLDFSSNLALIGDRLKKLSASLKQATKAGAKSRFKASDVLEQTKSTLAECSRLEKQCDDALARYAMASDREWSELDARVKEICAKRQWRVDGSWPSYIVAYGVHLEFDARTKTVSIASVEHSGKDLAAIETSLENEIRNLLPAKFHPHDFLETLALAYQDARRGSPQVPILDVYKWFVVRSQRPMFWRDARSEKFVGLTLEQFRARISKMLEANVLTTKGGRELRFYPPLDPKDALFLFNPLERRMGFVGRIEFSGASL